MAGILNAAKRRNGGYYEEVENVISNFIIIYIGVWSHRLRKLAKVGYKPDYQGFAQAGPAINEAFAAKSLDFAVYGDMLAITAKSNGVDVKIIASVSSQQDYAIVIGNQSDIKSVSDLKGKKIAVGFGTVTYKYLEDLLGLNGLGIGDWRKNIRQCKSDYHNSYPLGPLCRSRHIY